MSSKVVSLHCTMKVYIYIHIQSYSKVKKFVVITSVSANKAGKTIQTTLGPSPFHHLRASATPSKLADDGVGTGEAAFGDADEFFMRINPLLYRMFIYKDLHTYKGIHTYKYINRHYTQQRRRFHSPGRRRGLQICSYANISWIYIYIYVRHVEQRDSNVSRPEIYQLKFLACLMFSGALSRPNTTCGCCAGHSMKLTHGAEEFHALFSRAAFPVDTSRNSEERDVFSRSEKWLLSPPTARHESCLSREEEVCMNGFVQELINWAN